MVLETWYGGFKVSQVAFREGDAIPEPRWVNAARVRDDTDRTHARAHTPPLSASSVRRLLK